MVGSIIGNASQQAQQQAIPLRQSDDSFRALQEDDERKIAESETQRIKAEPVGARPTESEDNDRRQRTAGDESFLQNASGDTRSGSPRGSIVDIAV